MPLSQADMTMMQAADDVHATSCMPRIKPYVTETA